MLNIGIIGMGVISHYYVEAIPKLDAFRLTAVCDLNQERMDKLRAQDIKCYGDYRELLADPNVHGVVINLPNNLHFQACMDALCAGKHVCCEKPLTLDVLQAQQLEKTARSLGLTLLTAFHRRYNTHLLAAKASGSFDDAVAYIAHYDERIEEHAGADTWYLNPSACGGGCIADNGPNVFDTLSFMLGSLELVRVKARYNEYGLDMGAEIQLRTANGTPVIALLSWDYPHGECKDVIAVRSDGSSMRVNMLKDSVGFKTSLYHEYEGVLNHFAQAVRKGGEFGTDGVDAVRLVSGCYAALRAQIGTAGKNDLHGRLVKTMHHSRSDRGMEVIEFASRCVRTGEVHELVSTDQEGLVAGSKVDRVGFIGFMEVGNAGVIEIGDRVWAGDMQLGTVVGFDDCHFPNHYNILIKSNQLLTASEIPAAAPGMVVRFEENR